MSKTQNLAVDLKVVDRFLDSFNATDVAEAREASQALIKALKEARQAVAEGHERKELTVCTGRIGFVAPADLQRMIRDEIPRVTVYRKKKDNHHMPLYFKAGPGFYVKNAPAKKPVRKPVKKVKK